MTRIPERSFLKVSDIPAISDNLEEGGAVEKSNSEMDCIEVSICRSGMLILEIAKVAALTTTTIAIIIDAKRYLQSTQEISEEYTTMTLQSKHGR